MESIKSKGNYEPNKIPDFFENEKLCNIELQQISVPLLKFIRYSDSKRIRNENIASLPNSAKNSFVKPTHSKKSTKNAEIDMNNEFQNLDSILKKDLQHMSNIFKHKKPSKPENSNTKVIKIKKLNGFINLHRILQNNVKNNLSDNTRKNSLTEKHITNPILGLLPENDQNFDFFIGNLQKEKNSTSNRYFPKLDFQKIKNEDFSPIFTTSPRYARTTKNIKRKSKKIQTFKDSNKYFKYNYSSGEAKIKVKKTRDVNLLLSDILRSARNGSNPSILLPMNQAIKFENMNENKAIYQKNKYQSPKLIRRIEKLGSDILNLGRCRSAIEILPNKNIILK